MEILHAVEPVKLRCLSHPPHLHQSLFLYTTETDVRFIPQFINDLLGDVGAYLLPCGHHLRRRRNAIS